MATGWSGLYGANGYTPAENDSSNNRWLYRWGRRNRVVRALMDTLLGAVAGGTATSNNYQLPVPRDFAKVVVPTARAQINRATTAQDRTDTRAYFSAVSKIATPANKAGTNWRA